MARSVIPGPRAAVTPAAGTSVIGPIGRRARDIAARAALLEFRKIGAVFGATVNDAVPTVVASGYRALPSRSRKVFRHTDGGPSRDTAWKRQ